MGTQKPIADCNPIGLLDQILLCQLEYQELR